MVTEVLLDTGALVSLLDRSQTFHPQCVEFYRGSDAPLVTTEAVLTESTYLLSRVSGGAVSCIDFVLRGGVVVVPSTNASLRRCRDLMKRYSDLPMDFADSTLVVLAEELNTTAVFTLDRDFEIYRIHGRKPFSRIPRV